MTYDARAHGANCDSCPLNGNKPVPPQVVHNPRLIVLGEAPGPSDDGEGVPMSGGAGRHLQTSCKTFGVKRSDLHITNAVLCKTPFKKFKPAAWKTALECCKPRLDAELAQIPISIPIFAHGAKALLATTGKAKINPWVGAPLDGLHGRKVLPAMAVGLVLAKAALMPVWRLFFGRALQLADGELPEWRWPDIEINAGLGMVQLLERMRGKALGVDVETAGLDPMRDDLLCIGLASTDEAISVKFPIEDPQVETLVRELLSDPRTTKVVQNGGHDLLSFKYNGVEVNGPIFDLLLTHAVAAPQIPHDLGFMAAIEFHAPRWKSEFRVETDVKGGERFVKANAGDLRLYNAKDALMQAKLMAPLLRRLEQTHNGQSLFAEYTQLAELAMRMREGGMKVDTSRFDAHRARLTKIMDAALLRFRQVVADEKYQLGKAGQHHSLKELFFEGFGFRPVRFTDEGEPQLDEATLRDFIASGHPQASVVARAIVEYRKASKLRAVYVDGLTLDQRNYVHPIWKVHGTLSGRWASAEPNAQNVPIVMRDLMIAGE